MKQKMKTIQVGQPYDVIFSNKYLASQYLQAKTTEEMMLKKGERDVNKKKPKFSKTTSKRLKTVFFYLGSCIILVGYISLMILGGFVCILML